MSEWLYQTLQEEEKTAINFLTEQVKSFILEAREKDVVAKQ